VFERFDAVVLEQARLLIESLLQIAFADHFPRREKRSQIYIAFILGITKPFKYRSVDADEAAGREESANAILKQTREGSSPILKLESREFPWRHCGTPAHDSGFKCAIGHRSTIRSVGSNLSPTGEVMDISPTVEQQQMSI
jgi:hypothetical protein